MLLQYDISVVGVKNVDAALATIEKRWAQHNARVARMRVRGPSVAIDGGAGRGRASGRATAAGAMFGPSGREWSSLKRAEQSLDRQRSAALMAQHREKLRNIERERKAQERATVGAARAEARARMDFRRRTGAILGGAVSNSVGSVGRAAAVAAGLGGGALVATQLAAGVGLERRQNQAIINARAPGQAGAFTQKELGANIAATSVATGASQEGLTGAVERYVQKTGDIKTGVANLQVFAQTAMATGASVEDVASTAADLADKFNITSVEDMSAALAELTFQGKKGAFELQDMAQQFPEMAAAASRAGLKGKGGVKTLGGLAQIARRSTGSGSEASTAVQMMLTQLVHDSGRLASGEALGGRKVNIFSGKDATSPLRDTREVLADVISQSGGNLQQLQDVFDVRGIRAVSPMITRFREASAAAGGGEKGRAAGREAIIKMIDEASNTGATFADVQRDAADALNTTSAQLEILNTKLQQAISSELLPALTRLVPEVIKLTPSIGAAADALADFIGWAQKNPFSGIGTILAAKITADIATAGLGEAVKQSIITALGGAPSGGGAGGGKMNALGTALTGLAIASMVVTSIQVGELLIDKWLPSNEKDVEQDVGRWNDVAAGMANHDPEAIKRVREMYEADKANIKTKDPLLQLAEWFGAKPGEGKIGQAITEDRNKQLEQLNKQIAELIGIQKEVAARVPGGPGGAPPNRGNSPSPIK